MGAGFEVGLCIHCSRSRAEDSLACSFTWAPTEPPLSDCGIVCCHREWILHGRQPPQLGAVHQQLGMKAEDLSGGSGGAVGGAASDSGAAGGSVQGGQAASQADDMEL